jgi:predicted  nucleic acid-binding Zn-ribbon protein
MAFPLSIDNESGKLPIMTSYSYRHNPLDRTVDENNQTRLEVGEFASPASDDPTTEETWLQAADQAEAPGVGGRRILGWALALLAAAWIGFAAWSAGRSLSSLELTSPATAQWIAILTGPLALLGLIWLMFGRTRRKEAEAFTRSVHAMRGEARALEGLLGVLRVRIDENHSALRSMSDQLMGLGEDAAQRLGTVTAELGEGSRQLVAHGEALDRAAQAARVDIGVLLDDLPRAEATARSMAEVLRNSGSEASSKAAEFEAKVSALAARTQETDAIVTAAAQRLSAHLVDIEGKSTSTASRIEEVANGSTATVDALLRRSAEALEEIRGGIDAQARAVTALVEQSEAGIGKVGVDAAGRLGKQLSDANESLGAFATRLEEQDGLVRRLVDGIGESISTLDGRFALFADMGDQRAVAVGQSLERVRAELETIASRSGEHEDALHNLAERMGALRGTLDGLTADVRDQLATAITDAESGAARLLSATETASPAILQARDAAVEAGTRLEQGAGAIEAQHDRLAALLAAVDTGVGGAERRLAELSSTIASAEQEAGRLSQETGPALVQAMVQVREAAAHAAERAREAIAGVIPASSGQLSDSARDALERVVRETVAAQMAEIEAAASRAIETAQGASQRLTQQMLSIGQSAAALDAHFTETAAAQRERDSETFAKRVSLLIDSMHSASIDVGKILSDEVDDKSWAAYLRGDRGVFTRKAARLIGSGETRALAAHYESDREFQDSVNRYVHDFEAMLRRVSAEREGGPMAVTLMSSDMGKLYAALAEVVGSRR